MELIKINILLRIQNFTKTNQARGQAELIFISPFQKKSGPRASRAGSTRAGGGGTGGGAHSRQNPSHDEFEGPKRRMAESGEAERDAERDVETGCT